MRIDSFTSTAGQISNEANPTQAASQRAASTGKTGSEDRTTLTSGSTTVTSLVSQALNTPPVRQDKVDSLRLSVSSGQYDLDPAKTAASILDEHA